MSSKKQQARNVNNTTSMKKQVKAKKVPNVKSKKNIKKINRNITADPSNGATTINKSNSNCLSSNNPTLNIAESIQKETLAGIALAPVNYALQRGWEKSTNDQYPFQAWVGITNLLTQAMSGQLPVQSDKVPYWLLEIMNAIAPKSPIPFYGGKITFKFNTDLDATTLTNTIQVGPSSYGYEYQFLQPDLGTVNGLWPAYKPLVAAVYNSQISVDAMKSLFNFLLADSQNRGQEYTKMHVLHPINTSTDMTRDPSAYAGFITSPGGGIGNTGGYGGLAFMELPIRSPIFTKFNQAADSTLSRTRYTNQNRCLAGDTNTLSAHLCHWSVGKDLHMKTPYIFKTIDVTRFVMTAIYVVQQAILSKLQDAQVQTTEAIAIGTFDPEMLRVPMSLQNFILMIVSEIRNLFQDSQPGVQTLFPRSPVGLESQPVALLSNEATIIKQNVGVKFPRLYWENLRALTMRTNIGGRGDGKNPTMYIPVLTKMDGDEIPTDWPINYQIGSSVGTFQLFQPATYSQFAPEYNKDKTVTYGSQLLIENSIDIVDGFSTAISKYANIGATPALNSLKESWNKYYSTQLDSFTWRSDKLSIDGGPSLFEALTLTQHWKNSQPATPEERAEHMTRNQFISKEVNLDSPWEDRSWSATTFVEPPKAAVWTDVLCNFILPVNNLTPTNSDIPNTFTSFSREQGRTHEPNSLLVDEGFENSSINVMDYNFASLMVKDRNASEPAYIKYFDQVAAVGQGGILSALGGALDSVIGL